MINKDTLLICATLYFAAYSQEVGAPTLSLAGGILFTLSGAIQHWIENRER